MPDLIIGQWRAGIFERANIGRVAKDLLDKIRALPGVRSATFSENGLFSGTESRAHVRIEGYAPFSEADRRIRYDQVGTGYFTNVGIPILMAVISQTPTMPPPKESPSSTKTWPYSILATPIPLAAQR